MAKKDTQEVVKEVVAVEQPKQQKQEGATKETKEAVAVKVGNEPQKKSQEDKKPAAKTQPQAQKNARPRLSYAEIVELQMQDVRQILETRSASQTRLVRFLAAEKTAPNTPLFIGEAVFGPVKFPNGKEGRRYNVDVLAFESQMAADIARWISEFDEIKNAIAETREFIPGISKGVMVNDLLRKENQKTAEDKFAEVAALFGKAGSLIEEIKQLGFSKKELKQKKVENESADALEAKEDATAAKNTKKQVKSA